MKLARNQRCPIHGKYTCCGRPVREKRGSRWETVRPGVRRIRDEHADHPDGYRYKLLPAEMKKVVDFKIWKQNGACALCDKHFDDYSAVVGDHISPRGMGGARRDDRESNIQAAHAICNLIKLSQRKFKR